MNLLTGVLLEAAKRDGSGRSYIDKLTSFNTTEAVWAMIKDGKGLQGQLAKLVTRDNLVHFFNVEIAKIDKEIDADNAKMVEGRIKMRHGVKVKDPKNLRKRKFNLKSARDLIVKFNLISHLQEWCSVATEANKSRKELSLKGGVKVGPPSFISAGKVSSIALSNAKDTSVANFLKAGGSSTEIFGVIRKSIVDSDGAFQRVRRTEAEAMSMPQLSAVASRCYLMRCPQRRGYVDGRNEKRAPKAPTAEKGDNCGFFISESCHDCVFVPRSDSAAHWCSIGSCAGCAARASPTDHGCYNGSSADCAGWVDCAGCLAHECA